MHILCVWLSTHSLLFSDREKYSLQPIRIGSALFWFAFMMHTTTIIITTTTRANRAKQKEMTRMRITEYFYRKNNIDFVIFGWLVNFAMDIKNERVTIEWHRGRRGRKTPSKSHSHNKHIKSDECRLNIYIWKEIEIMCFSFGSPSLWLIARVLQNSHNLQYHHRDTRCWRSWPTMRALHTTNQECAAKYTK